ISVSGFGNKPRLPVPGFVFKSKNGKLTFSFQAKVGKVTFNYFGEVEKLSDSKVKIAFTQPDDAIRIYLQPLTPKVIDFIKLLEGEFNVENLTALDPSEVTFVSVSNPEISYSVVVK
ncbi:MAG: hypothetical protein K2N10_02745, partial [Muribaculaceae bacterium]|nr:hypothetical protein [Muribaculaceae bacterium]